MNHLGQPVPTARASHSRWPDCGQSRLSLPPRGQNLPGYPLAYHSEHLPFIARQHGRATRADRGALAPGCFTAGIPYTQPPAFHSPSPLALQRLPRQHHRQLCSHTSPVGTTGSSGTKPENAPHRAATSRGTSAIKESPASRETTANRNTANRKSPPADVNGGQRLHHQLRPPLRYGSELQTAIPSGHWVRPVRLPT